MPLPLFNHRAPRRPLEEHCQVLDGRPSDEGMTAPIQQV
jgi:hypothetical protein